MNRPALAKPRISTERPGRSCATCRRSSRSRVIYNPGITAQYLAAQKQITPSFQGEYHSITDCLAMVGVLDEAWDPDERRYTRRLTDEEILWIQNERLLCTHDFAYYSTHYCHIVDFNKELNLYRPNKAQEIINDIWSEMEAKRWAIMMMQLKARQLGVSTKTELAVAHRVQFHADVDAVVASSTPLKTEKMAKMIRTVWDHMPWWLMPQATKVSNLMPAEFGGHNSALDTSQSGNQFSGVSRGSTPNIFHGSELAEWSNPSEDIDASLLNAVHETPFVFVILESTALGRDNWWHKKWRLSKEGWDAGRARLCPIFLPWYTGTDIYPDNGWLLKHPVPPLWHPSDELHRYAKRAEAYVHTNSRLRHALGEHWVMPKEQLWWYDVTRDEYEKAGNLNRFLQECPHDDFSAFQSTNYSAFPVQVIQECRSRIKDPAGVYKLRGVGPSLEDVSEERTPMGSEVDTSKPIIDIPVAWGSYKGHFQLVPVTFEGYSQSPEMGRIFIYEHPRDEFLYGYGADTAEGIGLDRTVTQIVRKDTLLEPDAQVAEFASDYISGLEFWPWCMALGSYYSTLWQGERKQAKASIEVRGSGDALQYELRKRGWSNFLVWPRVLDNKKIDLSRATKIGFVTNPWSRPIALEIVLTWIKRNRILINSPYLVEEMESLEKDEQKQSMRAEFGAHDDRIMALAFILFAFHLHEIQSAKPTVADERESRLAASADPEYDPGPQGRDHDGSAVTTLESLLSLHPRYRR